MKLTTFLTIGLCAGLGTGIAAARTWTSADGTKTFEGEFQSYDADANKVTVTKTNGRSMTFSLDIISNDDQSWIKEQPSKPDQDTEAEAEDSFDESEAGRALRKTKVLKGNSFKSFNYDAPPKYFILYYSGSW